MPVGGAGRDAGAEGAPPALREMLSNPQPSSALPLSSLGDAAHARRAAPIRAQLGARGVAAWMPRLDALIGDALDDWTRRQWLGLNAANDALLWRIMGRMVLGSDALDDAQAHAQRVFLYARGAPGVDAQAARESHAALFAGYRRALARPDAAPDALGPRLLRDGQEAEVLSDVHHALMAGRSTWMVFVGLMRELERAPAQREAARAALVGSALSEEDTPTLAARMSSAWPRRCGPSSTGEALCRRAGAL